MEGVFFSVNFPNCVKVDENGDPILTAARGTSHVAYGPGGCPESHPYTIPTLTQNIYYAGIPYDSGWYLASDPSPAEHGTSLHADYMAAWTPEAAEIMAECVREGARECGPPRGAHHADQLYAPDGEQVYSPDHLADGVDSTPDELNGWPRWLVE